MRRAWVLSLVGLVCVFAALCNFAVAHDMDVSQSFDDVSTIIVQHDDQEPFKGFFSLTATNNGGTPWTDFHFQIMSCMGSDVSNVDIMDVDPYKPTTSQSPFTYAIDNVVVGSTLDYFFETDTVATGESATFSFYTDNTTDMVNFCVAMCPSVPEPTTLSMLGIGLVALLFFRRRK